MQSKSKSGVWVLDPVWQIAGVLFTASVLSALLYHYQHLLTPEITEVFLYPELLFFSVIMFYSLDHIHDELKFQRSDENRRKSFRLNSLLSALAAMVLAVLVFRNYESIGFRALYFPVLLTLLYFTLLFVFKINWKGIKEILIALVVTAAIFYPVAVFHGWAKHWAFMFPVFLVCLQNLVVFGFFEKDKDDFYGFSTIFSGISTGKVRRISGAFFLALCALQIVFYFGYDQAIPSVFYCAAFYGVMFLLPGWFHPYRLYRFAADGALLLLLL